MDAHEYMKEEYEAKAEELVTDNARKRARMWAKEMISQWRKVDAKPYFFEIALEFLKLETELAAAQRVVDAVRTMKTAIDRTGRCNVNVAFDALDKLKEKA